MRTVHWECTLRTVNLERTLRTHIKNVHWVCTFRTHVENAHVGRTLRMHIGNIENAHWKHWECTLETLRMHHRMHIENIKLKCTLMTKIEDTNLRMHIEDSRLRMHIERTHIERTHIEIKRLKDADCLHKSVTYSLQGYP